MAFQIRPDKKETENKTIRFPVPLIKRIESVIYNKDVSFSGFVIQACEYALDQMKNPSPAEETERSSFKCSKNK